MAEKERRGARARLTLAELLLDLFALGLTLIPLVPGQKRPRVRWKTYQHGYPEPAFETFQELFADEPLPEDGGPNVACVLGRASAINGAPLVVLDLDREVEDDRLLRKGFARLQALLQEVGVDDTWIVRSPSGGLHVYLRVRERELPDDFTKTKGEIEVDGRKVFSVDVLGNRSYVVIPPSIVDGRPYRALVGPAVWSPEKKVLEEPAEVSFEDFLKILEALGVDTSRWMEERERPCGSAPRIEEVLRELEDVEEEDEALDEGEVGARPSGESAEPATDLTLAGERKEGEARGECRGEGARADGGEVEAAPEEEPVARGESRGVRSDSEDEPFDRWAFGDNEAGVNWNRLEDDWIERFVRAVLDHGVYREGFRNAFWLYFSGWAAVQPHKVHPADALYVLLRLYRESGDTDDLRNERLGAFTYSYVRAWWNTEHRKAVEGLVKHVVRVATGVDAPLPKEPRTPRTYNGLMEVVERAGGKKAKKEIKPLLDEVHARTAGSSEPESYSGYGIVGQRFYADPDNEMIIDTKNEERVVDGYPVAVYRFKPRMTSSLEGDEDEEEGVDISNQGGITPVYAVVWKEPPTRSSEGGLRVCMGPLDAVIDEIVREFGTLSPSIAEKAVRDIIRARDEDGSLRLITDLPWPSVSGVYYVRGAGFVVVPPSAWSDVWKVSWTDVPEESPVEAFKVVPELPEDRVKEALRALAELDEFFDPVKLAAALYWAAVAPLAFSVKTEFEGQFIPALLLEGGAGTGKTTLGELISKMYGEGQDTADTAAQIARLVASSGFPILVDEAATAFAHHRTLTTIKRIITQVTARALASTNAAASRRAFLALSLPIFTINESIEDLVAKACAVENWKGVNVDAVLRRMIRVTFDMSDVPSEAKVATFNRDLRPRLERTVKYAGMALMARLVEMDDEEAREFLKNVADAPLTVGQDLWKRLYREYGVEEPAWLRVSPDKILELSTSPQDSVDESVRDKLREILEGGAKKAQRNRDPAVTAVSSTRLRWAAALLRGYIRHAYLVGAESKRAADLLSKACEKDEEGRPAWASEAIRETLLKVLGESEDNDVCKVWIGFTREFVNELPPQVNTMAAFVELLKRAGVRAEYETKHVYEPESPKGRPRRVAAVHLADFLDYVLEGSKEQVLEGADDEDVMDVVKRILYRAVQKARGEKLVLEGHPNVRVPKIFGEETVTTLYFIPVRLVKRAIQEELGEENVDVEAALDTALRLMRELPRVHILEEDGEPYLIVAPTVAIAEIELSAENSGGE